MKYITLTFSPALDVEYRVEAIKEGKTLRSSSCSVYAGGKGINVSRQLRKLSAEYGMTGTDVVSVAVLGGNTGRHIASLLSKEDIGLIKVAVRGESRINTSVISPGGDIEVNAPSPLLGAAAEKAEEEICSRVSAGDVVVLTGSLPKDAGYDRYARLCGLIKKKGGTVALDCDGEALRAAVEAEVKPDFIKPNINELEGLAGRKLGGREEIAGFCSSRESLKDISVIATMGKKGAVLTEAGTGQSFFCPAEKADQKRLKGAGDVFLASFLFSRFSMGYGPGESLGFAAKKAAEYISVI